VVGSSSDRSPPGSGRGASPQSHDVVIETETRFGGRAGPSLHGVAAREAAIRATSPKAVEHFSYRIPGFKLDGRPLVWYAAFKQHVSLYPVTAAIQRALADEIEGYETSKGTIRFPLDQPMPLALVRKIVRARAAVNRAKG
jgi:uncharacterized protein YdhG (YjbR/CyaY superfamily)